MVTSHVTADHLRVTTMDSHPLSNDPPTRRRNPINIRPESNYFSLKHASDERAQKPPAVFLVPTDSGVHDDIPQTAVPIGQETPLARTPILNIVDKEQGPTSQVVLSTRWHTLSDQEIQANIANLSSVQSPSEESKHPYHETIRILSAACERLVRQAAALEHTRKSLQQQETRRKRAAEQAVKELKPGQRDTGQQLLQAIYGSEPTETLTANIPKSPQVSPTNLSKLPTNTLKNLPQSLSEAMEEVWAPPSRELAVIQPTQPTQPLDIPPADAKSSRSRASSFTPSSANSYSARSEKAGQNKAFLGGWFGRSVSRASATPEQDDQDVDADADVISVVSATAPAIGNTPTAKMVTGVLRKGRSVFNAFGITATAPAPSPKSREEPPEPDASLSYTSSPASRITSLPFQAPLVSPVLPALTTISTGAPSITAFSLDSADQESRNLALEPPPVHPVEYLKHHGHPAHLRAIVSATRVMTADPRSILVDTGEQVAKLIAKGAMDLVQGAKDQGIVAYEPGRSLERKRSRSRPRRPSTPATGLGDDIPDDSDQYPTVKGPSATASLGRALAIQEMKPSTKPSGGGMGSKFRNLAPMAVAALGSPLLAAFPRSTRPVPASSPVAANPPSLGANPNPIAGPATQPAGPAAGPGTGTKKQVRGTVELNSIVPFQLQPPTQFLSRAYTSSRLTSPDFRPQLASRFIARDVGEDDEEAGRRRQAQRLGMTDRYGFIYGVNAYDVRLLQHARDASNSSPACLTGMKVQDQADEKEKEMSKAVNSPEKLEVPLEPDVEHGSSAASSGFLDEGVKSSASSGKSKFATRRMPTMRAAPSVTADTTPATANAATLTVAPAVSLSSSTVGALLDQLRTLHDEQQTAQTAEWNAFLKKRRQGGNRLGFIGAGNGEGDSDEEKEWGLGIVGISRMDAASKKEFARLVRDGVPLVYRDKVVSLFSHSAHVILIAFSGASVWA